MQALNVIDDSAFLMLHDCLVQKDIILNMSDEKLLTEVFGTTHLLSIGDTVVIKVTNLTTNITTHHHSVVIGYCGGFLLY
jgi:hypothetical protein